MIKTPFYADNGRKLCLDEGEFFYCGKISGNPAGMSLEKRQGYDMMMTDYKIREERNQMKLIHIADVHWGARPEREKPWGKERAKEIKETFRRVLERAKEQKTDLLLISGDFFERQPSLTDLREADYLLKQLDHTKTVWIAGNHDYLKKGTGLEAYEWESDTFLLKGPELEKISFPELNTTVYGFSYWQDQIEDPLYDSLRPEEEGDEIKILLAHGGDEKHIPIHRERLKWSGFDYIALGHIHKPEVIFEDLMAYAGSLEPLDHTETGRHGFMEGEISEERQIITFHPFSRREYVRTEVYVTEEMSGEEILDRIDTEISYRGSENIHEIILQGTMDPQIELDIERIQERYRISGITDQTKSIWERRDLSREDNLLMRRVAELLEDEPKALAYAMEALELSEEREV